MTDAPKKDRPWLIRTYAGHSTAEASNELYRGNLGQRADGPVSRIRSAHTNGIRQ